MPTIRAPRLSALPSLRHKEENDLGINVKGSDILRKNLKSRPPPSSPEPPPTERVKIPEWRPTSAVRKLGLMSPLPTLEQSAADVMSLARASRLLSADQSEIEDIKESVMSRQSECYVMPVTKSVACSPMSSWTSMSEDLLEHVSQRVVTEQQMSLSSRDSARQIKSAQFLQASLFNSGDSARKVRQRPQTASSSSTVDRKRPISARPTSSRPPSSARVSVRGTSSVNEGSSQGWVETPPPFTRASTATSRAALAVTSRTASRPASARSRPMTGRPSSGQSYRESLGETGIRLPSRAIERLVSAYEKEQTITSPPDRRPCTRSSTDSDLAQDLMRKKIHQGYNDMLKAFEVYDKNCTGYISKSEFGTVLGHFTVDLNKRQLHKLLDRSGLMIDWEVDRVPYQLFLGNYLRKGRGGCLKSPEPCRPQTGDTGRAELAETRLIAQLHSDFVDVLEAFRVHDREETGQIPLSDFRNIMSEYGLRVPEDQGDHCVDYLEYLRAVSELPEDASGQSKRRPNTAPTQMAIHHAYTGAEDDNEFPFQQLSLNLRPVHLDPRAKALVKLENCKLIKGGTRRPNRSAATTLQGQLTRKFGANNGELKRLMQIYDTARDGTISIGHFRDVLTEFNINIDENDFYNVVNKYDSSFRGMIPYKKLLSDPNTR